MVGGKIRPASALRGLVAGSALPIAFLVYPGGRPAGLALAQGAALYAVIVAVTSAWWQGWTGSRQDPARDAAVRLLVALTAVQALAIAVGQGWGPIGIRIGAFGLSALATPLIARWLRLGLVPCPRLDLPLAALLGAIAALRFPSAPLVSLTCVCAVLMVAAYTRGLFCAAASPGPRPRRLLPVAIAVLGWWYLDSMFPLFGRTLGTPYRLTGVGAAVATVGLAVWGVGTWVALRGVLASSRMARGGIALAPMLVGLVAGAALASRGLLTVGGSTTLATVLTMVLGDGLERPDGDQEVKGSAGGGRLSGEV
ncbi:MAG: hypothetical protein KatS3mg014_1831 [Actinomycetota bacterium]|nr:MAG: hypothetical protein KatS3mg014_1831 [Actinomycetota bacterium]